MPITFTQTFLSSLFLVGLGTFIFLSCGAFVGYAVTQRQGESSRLPWFSFGVIAVWFGVAMATSTAGLISLQLVLQLTLVPIVLGFLLSYTSKVKSILRAIPTHWLVGLQLYRVAGGIFIYPFFAEGVLTQEFALIAGIGDILTGLLAIPVALLLKQRSRWSRWALYGWSAFGILDLLVAMGIAGTFGFAAEGIAPTFPITIIPLFFGPPFSILLHLLTLRNFNLRHPANAQNNDEALSALNVQG